MQSLEFVPDLRDALPLSDHPPPHTHTWGITLISLVMDTFEFWIVWHEHERTARSDGMFNARDVCVRCGGLFYGGILYDQHPSLLHS